jgi:hypothetical protein
MLLGVSKDGNESRSILRDARKSALLRMKGDVEIEKVAEFAALPRRTVAGDRGSEP